MINLKDTKPGQIVFCISTKDAPKLVLGQKYIVKEVLDLDVLCVDGIDSAFFDHNFSIEEPIKTEKPSQEIESSSLLKRILRRNQNNFRLTKLTPFQKLSAVQQSEIEGCLRSSDDKAHHALGILLWGFISQDSPIAIISCNDLNALIKEAVKLNACTSFSVMGLRGTKTVWAQLTSLMTEEKIIQILKPQVGRTPAVIEIIHEDWVKLISRQVTDELRLGAINSGHVPDLVEN